MSDIYVKRGENHYGPFDRQTLIAQIDTGEFSRNDLAWYEALEDWQPLEKVLGLSKTVSRLPFPRANFVTQAVSTGPTQSVSGEVSVTDIDIPFWRLVMILLKLGIASIPAVIILTIICWLAMLVLALIGAVFFAGIHG